MLVAVYYQIYRCKYLFILSVLTAIVGDIKLHILDPFQLVLQAYSVRHTVGTRLIAMGRAF